MKTWNIYFTDMPSKPIVRKANTYEEAERLGLLYIFEHELDANIAEIEEIES